jgi:hypothetical protein
MPSMLTLLAPLRRIVAILSKLLERTAVEQVSDAPSPLPQLSTRIACRRDS